MTRMSWRSFALTTIIIISLLIAFPAEVFAEFERNVPDIIAKEVLGEETTENQTLEEEIPLEEAKPLTPAPAEIQGSEEGGEGEEFRSIVLDGVVSLSYVFDETPDSFTIKYHFHIEGKAAAKTAVIKGDAEINSQVEGYLSKWPTGECKLDVIIPKIPFEMTFRRTGEENGKIDMRFKGNIIETWQSHCSFTDAPGAKFDTKGDPEKWLSIALEKARPPLTDLGFTLDARDATTSTFTINKQTILDSPLGTAEIEGTGVITITPGRGE